MHQRPVYTLSFAPLLITANLLWPETWLQLLQSPRDLADTSKNVIQQWVSYSAFTSLKDCVYPRIWAKNRNTSVGSKTKTVKHPQKNSWSIGIWNRWGCKTSQWMRQITQARYNQKLLLRCGMMDNVTRGFLGTLIKLNITIIYLFRSAVLWGHYNCLAKENLHLC